jgi:hypothetical protein
MPEPKVKPYTKAMVKKYLKNPSRCPKCQSLDIAGDSLDFQTGSIAQKMFCNKCPTQWWDIYELVNVEAR